MTRRALLSVFDKTGIVEFARGLHDLGWELMSSGGTARVIADAGVPVTDVADYTGSPIMLGHRVVTLHPKIYGGILADRDDPEHRRDLESNEIKLIDLVVANLYPFTSEPGIEMIDIGGPAMVRGAAKNHTYVGVVVDPSTYEEVLSELRQNADLSATTRRGLARAAFAHTASYDAAIVTWMDTTAPEPEVLPQSIHLALERSEILRYGENPHQRGARYRQSGVATWWDATTVLAGPPLSYLNLLDASAAWALVHYLGSGAEQAGARPAVAIIKHTNPCGVSLGDDLAGAYQRAYECDSRSAFGGIVALNQVVDGSTADRIEAATQADVIIAPGYADGVVERLHERRKNTRILEAPAPSSPDLAIRPFNGGWLVQTPHVFDSAPDSWDVVSSRQPTEAEMEDAMFAWRVCGHVTSNAIVLAKDGTAWGIGAGQQNRVQSAEIAASKADGRAAGGASASDGFYPFPDGIEAAVNAGVAVVVQPGGSQNDADVIARAEELGLTMILTGERQFRH